MWVTFKYAFYGLSAQMMCQKLLSHLCNKCNILAMKSGRDCQPID